VSESDCFLDSAEWKSVIAPSHGSQSEPSTLQISNEFYNLMVALPGLVKATRSLRSYKRFPQAQHSDLLERTRQIHGSLLDWFQRFMASSTLENAPVFRVPSATRDTQFASVYHYRDNFVASLLCSYYASMIILNDLIVGLDPRVDYKVANLQLADKVCMSVEYAAKSGFLGTHYIVFALTVAYSASSVESRAWMKAWLIKLADIAEVARFSISAHK
jgi:hypothetical protein